MRNEVLHRVKEERNFVRLIKRRKANWIGHILSRNCFTEGKIEGWIEVTGRCGSRCEQLLDDLIEKRGYWKQRGSTRSHSVENRLRKRFWTCRKAYYRMDI